MGDSEIERRLAVLPTAPIAAGGLIAGFGVAMATGSRPLGGVVLAACGLTCLAAWRQRDPSRTAAGLTITGVAAFALSHLLGTLIGAWPAVLIVSALTAVACWRWSDSRREPGGSARQHRLADRERAR